MCGWARETDHAAWDYAASRLSPGKCAQFIVVSTRSTPRSLFSGTASRELWQERYVDVVQAPAFIADSLQRRAREPQDEVMRIVIDVEDKVIRSAAGGGVRVGVA